MKKFTLLMILIIVLGCLIATTTPVANTSAPPQCCAISKANTVQVYNPQTSCPAILPAPTLLNYSPPNLVENQQLENYIDIPKPPVSSNSPPQGNVADNNLYFAFIPTSPAPASSAIYYNYEITLQSAQTGNSYEDSKSNGLATGFKAQIYEILKTTISSNIIKTNLLIFC